VSGLAPFVKVLARPLVLLQQQIENNGWFVRFAVRERVLPQH
jgi:hypothetical protein